MEYTVNVGASRERLLQIAQELTTACESQSVDLTIYAEGNASHVEEVRLTFSNDDMEGRDDLKPEAVIVDVETD